MTLDFTALRASVTNVSNSLTAKISGRVTPSILETEISKSVPASTLGQIPFNNIDGTRQSVADHLLRFGVFVNTPEELSAAQSVIVNNETIFNTWYRFSHRATTEDQPAEPTEINSWTYDNQTDTLTNTINTNSTVGVVSTAKYTNYDLEVRFAANNGDDDAIGILLAWYVDPNTGREYTLTAFRSPGGWGFTWELVYNFGRSDMAVITNKSNTIRWGNGGTGLTASQAGYTAQIYNWNTLYPAGTKVRAIRNSDIIDVITTEFQNPEVYVEASRIIVDLSSNPLLEKFRGPRSYGYAAMSQAMAQWIVLNFNDPSNNIYDLSTGYVYVFNSPTQTWVHDSTKSLSNTIGLGRLMYNPTTKKMFFTNPNGEPQQIEFPV